MSMWTDREVKKLIGRVNEIENKVNAILGTHPMSAEELTLPPEPPHIDKRTREYRATIGKS